MAHRGTEGGRGNSSGWTAQGVVDDLINGGQVHYNEEVRIGVNPQSDEFFLRSLRIQIH